MVPSQNLVKSLDSIGYLGFGLLMLGVVMSYFSHSQVWAVTKDGKLYLGGRTNRAQVVFEREMIEIIEIIDRLQSSGTANCGDKLELPTVVG